MKLLYNSGEESDVAINIGKSWDEYHTDETFEGDKIMLCEHLKELQQFVKENELEVGGLDMLKLVCKKCNVQHECPEISVEYWEETKPSQDEGEGK